MAESDRRLRTRYKVRVPFTIKSNSEEIQGVTRNVSLLGISAYSDSTITHSVPVQCMLHIPQQQRPIIAHGTVIRCEPLSERHPDGGNEVGVFFKQFEGTHENDLDSFLHKVLEDERAAIRAGFNELRRRASARKKKKIRVLEIKQKKREERLRKRRLRLLEKMKAKKRGPGRPKGSRNKKKKSTASRTPSS